MKSEAASFLSEGRTLEQRFLIRCRKHLCLLASGNEASTAPSMPANPSETTTATSASPLDLKLAKSELLLIKWTTDRREIYIQMQTVGQPPRGFAPNGAGKETMEEIKKLTKEEEMDVGRQIYDRLLTIPIAAEKFGVTYSAARRWLRAYRAANGLPPSNGGFSKPAAAAAKADIGALDSMTRDQLIDEVIKARADAERAKKWYTVKGGGAGKAFFSLEGASLK